MSNIKRKPAIENVQEDSQDLDQTTASLDISEALANRSNDTSAEGQSNIGDLVSVPEKAGDTTNIEIDNVNLFEEEKELNLIDRDAEVADGDQQLIDEQNGPGEQTARDETTIAALSSTQAGAVSPTPVSSQAKQATKKKVKLKTGPQRKDPDKPIIMILDSLCGTHSNATRALREWLQAEGLEKRGMTVEIDNKGHYPRASQIPMQRNFSDCGLYVLGYARKFFSDPDEFRIKLLQQQMSAELDWPDMDASQMRHDIRDIIVRIYNEQKEARKEAHKAKKIAKGKDIAASPMNAGSKEASPAVQQPDAAKSKSPDSVPGATKLEPTSTATMVRVSTPPTVTHRHLGSPFKVEAKADRDTSPATRDAQKDDTAYATSTTKDSLCAITKTSLAQPRLSPIKRTKSPEVRVPAKSPHIDLSAYEPYDGASDRSKRPVQQSNDVISPPQDHGLRSKSDGKLRKPPAKKIRGRSPSKPPRERAAPSSPLQARTRSGSHDDPITLDDSQDLDAPVKKQPQSAKKAQPEVIDLDRSQESVQAPARRIKHQTNSSPVRHRARHQVFDRDDSIQEVIGHQREEGRDITRALKESLLDQEKSERIRHQANNPPFELGGPMEDVFDAQAAYTQSSRTVQEVPETQVSQAMDVDDEEVPETPPRQRSSPGPDVMELE